MKHFVIFALLIFISKASEVLSADVTWIESVSCPNATSFSLIVHGWQENCSTPYVIESTSKFAAFYQCVICMDYRLYSMTPNFFTDLLPKFDYLSDVCYKKLVELRNRGMDTSEAILYGFSFGAQIVLEAGRRFRDMQPQPIVGRIDACDPVGLGFDMNVTYVAKDLTKSASFVQCIHTSFDKGTQKRSCHQDWDMGYCGYYQSSAGPYPNGSHGRCTDFYNSAFTNTFPAIPKPAQCTSARAVNPIYFDGMQMGFKASVSRPIGDYFATTSKRYPYNGPNDDPLAFFYDIFNDVQMPGVV